MCSYNAVNGDFACENKYLLTDVLKKELGVPGLRVSDWGGTHSTVKASAAGLDQEQPDEFFYGEKLKKAVRLEKFPQPNWTITRAACCAPNSQAASSITQRKKRRGC